LARGYSIWYGYVRSRQLEGTYNEDPTIGCWPITAYRIERGWGNPGEARWPMGGHDESWPPKEPAHIDQYAKEKTIFAYQRIRSVAECKEAILKTGDFMLSVEATEAWYNAPNGKIPLPKKPQEIISGHGFGVVGYDDHNEEFKFQNSWGIEWGDKGYGYLPYKYFETLFTEAWVDIRPKRNMIEKFTNYRKAPGGLELQWRLPSVLHDYIYGIEIRDSKTDDCKAWGFAFEYDNYLNIEELFVKPKYRGKYYSNQLVTFFKRTAKELSIPLRVWISHPDNCFLQVGIPHFCKIFSPAPVGKIKLT